MVPSVSILCSCDSKKELMQMYITKRFSLLMPIWLNLYIHRLLLVSFSENFNELIQWTTKNKRFKVFVEHFQCYWLWLIAINYCICDLIFSQYKKDLDRRKIYISSHNCNTKAWVQVYEGLHPTLKSIIINS